MHGWNLVTMALCIVNVHVLMTTVIIFETLKFMEWPLPAFY